MSVATVADDPAVFAERVLRQPLWPHQLQAARCDRFITAIAAARRTGKTTLVEVLSIWTAFRERNVRVVILSATQDASRRVTESIASTLAECDLARGSVVEDFATRIRLSNGSEIVSLPASQRQVRGYGKGVKLLVIDEAGFVPNELWQAAQYVALDERANGSRIILCGTPWGGPDMFFRQAFEAGQTGDVDRASFHWMHTANPLLDHAYLERQRGRVSPQEYAAEVLGEWSDAAGALFARELLERQTADVEVPALGQLRGPAMPLAGFDHGASFDRSAFACLYRLPVAVLNPEVVDVPRFVVVPHVWPVKTPLSDTVDDVAALPIRCRVLTSETNGLGAMPSQELVRRARERHGGLSAHQWNLVATTNARKTAGYGAVLALLERGQLVLPRHPDLLRQLAGLRFEQGERGFTKIEAADAAVHDDVADALMLAAAPFVQRGRSTVKLASALLRCAAPEVALPDANVGAPDVDEVVSTGGGLQVWRRTPLQSVAADMAVSFHSGWGAGRARSGRPARPAPVEVISLRHPDGRLFEVEAGTDEHSHLVAVGATAVADENNDEGAE